MNDFMRCLYNSYIKPQLDNEALAECQSILDRAEFLQDADLEALFDRYAEKDALTVPNQSVVYFGAPA